MISSMLSPRNYHFKPLMLLLQDVKMMSSSVVTASVSVSSGSVTPDLIVQTGQMNHQIVIHKSVPVIISSVLLVINVFLMVGNVMVTQIVE